MICSGPSTSALIAEANQTMDELTLKLAKLKLQLTIRDLSLRLQERESELIDRLDRLNEEKVLLEKNPEGIRWTELLSQIKKSDRNFHPKTVNGCVWKLIEKFPDKV